MTHEEYLLAMEEEGCTGTVAALTDNVDVPLVLHHDGATCPIHES